MANHALPLAARAPCMRRCLPTPPPDRKPQLTTPVARSSVVLSMFFMMRSTICSTHGFSQPARMQSTAGTACEGELRRP